MTTDNTPAAISEIAERNNIRVVLYINGKTVHAPLSEVVPGIAASSVSFEPFGHVEADNVQDAIEKIITEGATLDGSETLTNKTLTSPAINDPTLVLKQSSGPTPTAEGEIQWDTDDDVLVVGDGSGQKRFLPLTYQMASQVFTASGTYTPTAGMLYCLVIATGGGGGAGGADSNGSVMCATGGASAGATVIGFFSAADIGASQSVTIGAGGAGGFGSSGGNGNNGSATTFGSLLSAAGGALTNGTGNAPSSDTVTDGAAGATASGGILAIDGGDGLPGVIVENSPIDYAYGGAGGSSFWGGGPRGSLIFTFTSGLAGKAWGSGGSGAAIINNTNGLPGGAGKSGVVFILELVAT